MVRLMRRQFKLRVFHIPGCNCIFAVSLFLLLVLTGRVSFADENSPAGVHASRDFGYLPQKAVVGHVFQVHNTGTDSLKVNKIESGCSCTSVSKIERPIPPGDSAAVTVIFKSGRYHHRVSKTTKVYTDDPLDPVRRFRIISFVFKKGEETGSVTVTPLALEWKIEKDTLFATVDTLRITNHSDRGMKMEIVHMPDELFENIIVPDDIAPGQTACLVLEIPSQTFPEAPEGLSLTMAFTGSDTTRVTVPLVIKD